MGADDDNPFNRPNVAADWIGRIEGESGRVRESDIYPRLKAWIKSVPASNALEVGCGQGICSEKIDFGGLYIGIDSSEIMVERARILYSSSKRRFVLGSAYDLPVSPGSFDAIFSVTVWHLLADPRAAARELGRVLGPGGSFLIITANPGAYDSWTEPYTDTHRDGPRFEGILTLSDGSKARETLFLWPLDEIVTSLREAGLQVEKTETFRSSAQADRFIQLTGKRI